MESWEKIIRINKVDSTNVYCSNILKQEVLTEGTIVCSLFQEKGKGHNTNSWESEKRKNMLLSLVLYPDFLAIDKQFLLSKVISLGIANYAYSKTNFIKIKWPNDIYYKDKKLAGILIENVIKGTTLSQSIVGIGFNLNQTQFLSDAPNPCSLSQITGKTYSPEQEIVKLRNNIRFFYDKLKAGKHKEIDKEYLKCMYRFNEYHHYESNDKKLEGKITGVNELGHIQILTRDSKFHEFDLKEVKFVL